MRAEIENGEIVEQHLRFAETARGARQVRRAARKARFESGQHFMAQMIARETGIGIALVVDPAQPMRAGVSLDRIASNGEKRTQQSAIRLLHRRRAAQAGAAQQIEQQRLGLIVAMMRKYDPIVRRPRERRVACAPGGRLQAVRRIAFDLDAFHGEGNIPRRAQRTTVIFPAIGVGAQGMMDMERRQRNLAAWRRVTQGMQQDDRIQTARQSGNQGLTAGDAALEASLERSCDKLSGSAL
ncbi:MAG: hypothetical protein PHY45_12790 [Rhodocyclaceae bacterium]|nr:hypothetical protein [Rhodocyclaceae bacterium]